MSPVVELIHEPNYETSLEYSIPIGCVHVPEKSGSRYHEARITLEPNSLLYALAGRKNWDIKNMFSFQYTTSFQITILLT